MNKPTLRNKLHKNKLDWLGHMGSDCQSKTDQVIKENLSIL